MKTKDPFIFETFYEDEPAKFKEPRRSIQQFSYSSKYESTRYPDIQFQVLVNDFVEGLPFPANSNQFKSIPGKIPLTYQGKQGSQQVPLQFSQKRIHQSHSDLSPSFSAIRRPMVGRYGNQQKIPNVHKVYFGDSWF